MMVIKMEELFEKTQIQKISMLVQIPFKNDFI